MQPLNCSYCSMNFTLCVWEIQHRLTWEEPCSSHAWLPTLEFAGTPLSQVQAGELLAANPKPDGDIKSCSSLRMLDWLTDLHPVTVSNVSPENFFGFALNCRKWTTEHEAGRAKAGTAHGPLLAKCVQPQTGEARALQKQPSHNPTGTNRGVPRLLCFSWGKNRVQYILCIPPQQSPSLLLHWFLLV